MLFILCSSKHTLGLLKQLCCRALDGGEVCAAACCSGTFFCLQLLLQLLDLLQQVICGELWAMHGSSCCGLLRLLLFKVASLLSTNRNSTGRVEEAPILQVGCMQMWLPHAIRVGLCRSWCCALVHLCC